MPCWRLIRNAPRKQRHTAHRIFERIRSELPERKVAEVTVRQYVRERKRESGWSTRATCVPQSDARDQEGQVDWYEAWTELGGPPVLLQVFSMRSMLSGAAFSPRVPTRNSAGLRRSPRTCLSLFWWRLRILRYDNLKAAAKKILRGYRRKETAHFIAFRSHWRFQSEFCMPRSHTKKAGSRNDCGRLPPAQSLGADGESA